MIGLVFNLCIVVFLVMLALARPGAGIAVALALGRHTFPDRTSPIVAAAPLLLMAAALGLYHDGRRIRLTAISVGVSVLIAAVALVGYLGSSGVSNPAVLALSRDKTMFLLVVAVPLVLLAPMLSDWSVRRDCLLALVVVPCALVLLSVATGSTDNQGSGRSVALGGGPITLATIAGFGILILVFHDDDLLPKPLREFSKPYRLGSVVLLTAGMLLTGSRQPVLALVIVIGLASFTAASASSVSLTRQESRRRIRRIRTASAVMVVAGVAGLWAFVTARPDSRFVLLLDPTAELRRSRLGVWEAGIDRVVSGPVPGHGFGSFVTFPLPAGTLDYPHNIFIELLSEVGLLLGGIASVAIILGVVSARKGGLRVLWLLTVLAFLGVQFSGDLYNSRYLMFFAVAGLTVRSKSANSGPVSAPSVGDDELLALGGIPPAADRSIPGRIWV